MAPNFISVVSITINAPASRVWRALTDPAMIKQYMFGSEVVTEWKEGSPIIYKGEWNGKSFEDKGKIITFDLEHILITTHYSPLSGMPDTEENYHTVKYELVNNEETTSIILTQDKNASEEEKMHAENNWKMMLENLKKLVEESN